MIFSKGLWSFSGKLLKLKAVLHCEKAPSAGLRTLNQYDTCSPLSQGYLAGPGSVVGLA
jgi:hypothetical protein